MNQTFAFPRLPIADLIVDAIYESSTDGQLSSEPISKLLQGSGNMGDFHASGRGDRNNWVVLLTTGEDQDWPGSLYLNTGKFIYFGDNKTPGHELHDTHAGGNKVFCEDRHPILFISGRDTSEILNANGFNTVERVAAFLASEFDF